jgi:hypothetical protein
LLPNSRTRHGPIVMPSPVTQCDGSRA